MKLYLVNKNPIITKLVSLSVSKINLDMVETQEIDSTLQADILLLDDECYTKETYEQYKQENSGVKTILFYAKSTERVEGFDEYVQKPFLPTELVRVLSEVSGMQPLDNVVGVANDIQNDEAVDEIETLQEPKAVEPSTQDESNQELDLSEYGELEFEQDIKAAKTNGEKPKILDRDDIDEVKQLFEEAKENQENDLDFEEELIEQENHNSEAKEDNQQEIAGGDFSLEDLDLEEGELEELESENQANTEDSSKEVVQENIEDLDIDNLASSIDNLEEELKAQEEFGEEIADEMQLDNQEEGIEQESQESQESQEKAANHDEIINESSSEDEFDDLNIEAMSEALGEPIAKEPSVVPIVAAEKIQNNPQINSLESLISALQTLQTQSLKDLLSGATINISIQFPKKED